MTDFSQIPQRVHVYPASDRAKEIVHQSMTMDSLVSGVWPTQWSSPEAPEFHDEMDRCIAAGFKVLAACPSADALETSTEPREDFAVSPGNPMTPPVVSLRACSDSPPRRTALSRESRTSAPVQGSRCCENRVSAAPRPDPRPGRAPRGRGRFGPVADPDDREHRGSALFRRRATTDIHWMYSKWGRR